MFILHTLYLLSGSLTTMSLACSPIASPVSFLLASFSIDRYLFICYSHFIRYLFICQ
nr:MAG TPA: membrane protein [Caudoviricetes sp.]